MPALQPGDQKVLRTTDQKQIPVLVTTLHMYPQMIIIASIVFHNYSKWK